jgi:hypothetical protein
MVTFPAWLLGGVLCVASISGAMKTRSSIAAAWFVSLLAFISIGSVVWSVIAAKNYESESPTAGNKPS